MKVMKAFMLTRVKDQSGFTLLEGMLASVVLAVGLLSLAGMQGMSLGRNLDANELGAVTNLTADMVERIQFNRRNVTAYNNINTTAACAQDPVAQPMARGDCVQWQALLAASRLANVQGVVQVTPIVTNPPLNQNQVIVQISWTSAVTVGQDSNSMGGGGPVAPVTASRPRNVIMGAVVAPE